MLYEDNYLAHHGVKGQKWGVRRYQDYNGELTPEGKERYAGDKHGVFAGIKQILSAVKKTNPEPIKKQTASVEPEKKAETETKIDTTKKKNPSEMSDVELRDNINRMRAESEYNRLYNELNRKPESKLKKTLEQIFISTATTALSSVVQDQYRKGLAKITAKSDAELEKERLKKDISEYTYKKKLNAQLNKKMTKAEKERKKLEDEVEELKLKMNKKKFSAVVNS